MKRPDKIRYIPKTKPFANIQRDDKFYHSPAWRKVRRWYIKRHPLCEECERRGKLTTGMIVDHIIPINNVNAYDTTGHGEPLRESNLQTLCVQCHNSKSGRSRQ